MTAPPPAAVGSKPAWTIPNTITMVRLAGAVALFVLLSTSVREVHAEWIAQAEGGLRGLELGSFLLFVLAASTDALDGWLARRYGWTSAFGRVADPFVDKILICGTLVLLCANPLSAGFVPAWFVVVLIGREFLVTGLRGYVESQGIAFPADTLGKLKMIAQCGLIALVLWRFASQLRPHLPDEGWTAIPITVALWTTLILTVVSGAQYVLRARPVLFG